MSQKVINQAKAFCIQQKARLTKPRIEVLKIIASSSKPIGAYGILEKLGLVIDSPKPPTVYRAIDFWLRTGFIHAIESLNAYVVCQAEHRHSGAQFMICDGCGQAIEAYACEMPQVLRESLANANFVPSNWTIEVRGSCSHCRG